MLTVDEALATILSHAKSGGTTPVPLAGALGHVLREEIVADTDSPPFDKALMDGFAVCVADLAGGKVRLAQIEEVTAGRVPTRAVSPGHATRIMTGAPLPDGADAVVPIEVVEVIKEGNAIHAQIDAPQFITGRNILRRGQSTRVGESVLEAGRLLRAQELGCLAELGRATVAVEVAPRVGVLATGDELVPVDDTPGPGQIRNSNETMLVAQVHQAGATPVPLGIARDEIGHLKEKIAAGLELDVLLLSGGVSAGNLDLVPGALQDLGVEQVFHKVRVKPGQPLWFGVHRRKGGATLVFGLPGNPVGSMVCFELFVRPVLNLMRGLADITPKSTFARLTEPFTHVGSRPTYHPAQLSFTPAGPLCQLVPWVGSADLSATVEANCMAVFPAGDAVHAAGEMLQVIPW